MIEKENPISLIIKERTIEPQIKPKQSANSLFRFFSKQEYLVKALQEGALIPRYYSEYVEYLDIGYNQIAYPMICFCDINVHRLKDHLDLYGKYGIAFSKTWGIEKGVQPIQYINKDSFLCKDLAKAFTYARSDQNDNIVYDYLLSQMFFIKPIVGKMPRNGQEIEKNFMDEREWRFIPNVAQLNLPQTITEEYIPNMSVLNKTISDHSVCWLRFDYNDIKYIIIEKESDFNEVCSTIERKTDDGLRKKLISKIMVWEEIEEDF